MSEKAKRGLGPIMRSGLYQACLSALDFFGDIDSSVSSIVDNAESNCFPCFPCVSDSAKENLTSPQRELLLWHWKLGINMTYEEPLGQRTVLPSITKAKFPSARNCVIPLCQSCLLARARKHSSNVKWSTTHPGREGALSHDWYEVGDFISTDQFICWTPGWLPEGHGHESADHHYQGGTIYNDTAFDLIWVENQVSLGTNEMVMGHGLCWSQTLPWQ